ncbi:MAG TPA: hypothetical protein VF710_26450, partial [Longimicrobium sp.]
DWRNVHAITTVCYCAEEDNAYSRWPELRVQRVCCAGRIGLRKQVESSSLAACNRMRWTF